jgi:hypothetical protein
MNLLTLSLLAGGCLVGLWLVQSAFLLSLGEPLAWPLRFQSRAPALCLTMRAMIQLCWVGLLVGGPFAMGTRPSVYFGRALVSPDGPGIALAFAIALAIFGAAWALQYSIGWLRFAPQHDARTRRVKLVRRFATCVPLACMEEAVFRGLVLEQIHRALPGGGPAEALGILVSAVIFSAVHFVRPHLTVRQPAVGLFAVGVVLGTAYVSSGHSLWLPIALHAAGILYTEVSKLYTEYRGPARFVGTPVFPHCGIVGITALLLLTMVVVTCFH